MKSLLFVLLLALGAGSVSGQCSYVWENDFNDDLTCTKQSAKKSVVPANCTLMLPVRYLDSIVNDVTQNRYVFKRGTKRAAVLSDFRMYKYDTLEIVHYSSEMYLIDSDSLIVHDISFTQWSGGWSEDGCYHFLYHPDFGIIARKFSGMEMPVIGVGSGWTFLKSNSCLSVEKNKKLQELIFKIRNDGIK